MAEPIKLLTNLIPMKTLLIFTLLICAFQSKIEAQQDSTYYYQFGEKVFITPVAESYIIEFRDTSYAAILDSLELEYNRLWWTIYEVNNDSASVYQINDTLCTITRIISETIARHFICVIFWCWNGTRM